MCVQVYEYIYTYLHVYIFLSLFKNIKLVKSGENYKTNMWYPQLMYNKGIVAKNV